MQKIRIKKKNIKLWNFDKLCFGIGKVKIESQNNLKYLKTGEL
jgi:hypothetical protein